MPKAEYKKTQMTLDLSDLQTSSYQGFSDFLNYMFSYVFSNFLYFFPD